MQESLPSKRANLRPDLERFAKEPRTDIFLFDPFRFMPEEVVNNVISQWPELNNIPRRYMEFLASDCLIEIQLLHNTADIIKNPPVDIDAVWIISAPGLLLEQGSKPGWSANYPWMDNLEWEVVGSGLALTTAVTARRLGKQIDQITRDDVKNVGPWLIYNGPDYETEPLRTLLDERHGIPVSLEKTLIYEQYIQDGIAQTIRNTADQAASFRLPEGLVPRRLAISVLAAQWSRLGRLLARTKIIPPETEILLVPTASPVGYEREHAILEAQGAVINVFKHNIAEEWHIRYKKGMA